MYTTKGTPFWHIHNVPLSLSLVGTMFTRHRQVRQKNLCDHQASPSNSGVAKALFPSANATIQGKKMGFMKNVSVKNV